jgi:hypothetical protein
MESHKSTVSYDLSGTQIAGGSFSAAGAFSEVFAHRVSARPARPRRCAVSTGPTAREAGDEIHISPTPNQSSLTLYITEVSAIETIRMEDEKVRARRICPAMSKRYVQVSHVICRRRASDLEGLLGATIRQPILLRVDLSRDNTKRRRKCQNWGHP